MPEDCPPILIAQHMPGTFTKLFAKRLDGLCKITVKEAEDNEAVLPGHAYVAPGGFHLRLERFGTRGYGIKIGSDAAVNLHRPSVDVLFMSAAESAGADAIGVILTGMGKDGAHGLLAMRKKGAFTIAQDEASSIVFGMPKEAIDIGAAEMVAPLNLIARRIMSNLAGSAMTAAAQVVVTRRTSSSQLQWRRMSIDEACGQKRSANPRQCWSFKNCRRAPAFIDTLALAFLPISLGSADTPPRRRYPRPAQQNPVSL